MKKSILLAATLVVGLAGAAQAQTVRIGTEGAYAPWNYVDDNGKLAGFEIDLGSVLCEKAGLTCEFVQNEWDTIIPNLLAGNYDVIMAAMTITDERMQTIDFSDDYYPPEPSMFAVVGGTMVDLDTLKGAKIGAQGATIQADYAAETFGADNTILTYETADQAMADLAAGNLDIVFADGGYLKPIVSASDNGLEFVGPGVSIGGGIGLGFRKEDADLRAKFDAAIGAMKADGSLNAMIAEAFDDPALF